MLEGLFFFERDNTIHTHTHTHKQFSSPITFPKPSCSCCASRPWNIGFRRVCGRQTGKCNVVFPLLQSHSNLDSFALLIPGVLFRPCVFVYVVVCRPTVNGFQWPRPDVPVAFTNCSSPECKEGNSYAHTHSFLPYPSRMVPPPNVVVVLSFQYLCALV